MKHTGFILSSVIYIIIVAVLVNTNFISYENIVLVMLSVILGYLTKIDINTEK